MIEIQDNQALAKICEEASQQPFITFDTEFIRERTYYPILALVQISWEGCESVLIDPLEITDWSPFHDILSNEDICKVFHAGRQDLEIFYFQMKEMPKNLFDTQIAASMCGLGDQIGYSGLVERLMGVRLAKGSSYTNWLQRPLTTSQLRYARDDVIYLPGVYKKLLKKARDKRRLDWILEEMKAQLHEGLFEPDPMQLWRKVKKVSSLRGRGPAILQALARWRYEVAKDMNKPVRFILSDEVLVELSKIDRLNLEHLSSRRGVQNKIIDRFGKELIRIHGEAAQTPKDQWPTLRNPDEKAPSDKSEALADLGWLLIKEIARKSSMAPTHLINKKDLANFFETMYQGGDVSRFSISKGWRHEMVGAPLMDLVEGRLAIRVENRRIIWHKSDEA